ncbi:hypothetical protein [Streptomyces agglomeratus]|uniref:hypothetical protein n=1 Tax=Streptomyces agglomeratus TaxID=285458 RepID=UPI00210931F8|nr:hypothetical protein [Streptomyces agglomeratus]
MTEGEKTMRGRGGIAEAHRRPLAVLTLCAALTLTACKADDSAPPGTDETSSTSAAPVTPAAGASAAAPTVTASAARPSTVSKPTPAGSPATAPGEKEPKPPAPGATCDHKMPISPDEIAVNRYTPEGGFHSLIVKHGNWGCGTPDTDGAPFETVGVETFIPIAEDAKITAVTPVVESTENKQITLQQLIDWLVAHPNQGLVFRYHLGPGAKIDTLDQVFTP